MLYYSGKRWKIPPIKVVQNLHQYGGIFPPSARRWKIPPCHIHLFWWTFSTIWKQVEPYQGEHLLIIAVASVNTVEWYARECHCVVNSEIYIKSLDT